MQDSAVTSIAPTRPVMRYHGGKWQLAPWIIEHFPAHRIYVEPFAGAGSVLLRKPRAEAEVYNDLDGDVVNLFRVLRDDVQAGRLIAQLELTPWSRAEFYAAYEETTDPIERARRLIVRSFMGHGTTARRKNRTGFRTLGYRTAGGSTAVDEWTRYPAAIRAFADRLRGVCIEERNALEVIAQQDSPDTLFYVDPPYPLDTRTSVRCPSDSERAYRHNLTDEQHRELGALLREVQGMVVLSGYPCDLYDRELFCDWLRVSRATFADGGNPREEVLWLNATAAAGLRQQSLFSGGLA